MQIQSVNNQPRFMGLSVIPKEGGTAIQVRMKNAPEIFKDCYPQAGTAHRKLFLEDVVKPLMNLKTLITIDLYKNIIKIIPKNGKSIELYAGDEGRAMIDPKEANIVMYPINKEKNQFYSFKHFSSDDAYNAMTEFNYLFDDNFSSIGKACAATRIAESMG